MFSRSGGVVLFPILLLVLAPLLRAQTTSTWDAGGADSSWGTASNWVGDVVPTFNTNAILLFDTNVGGAITTFLGGDRQVRGITFGANLTGGTNALFDIQTRTTLNGGSGANLLFNGGATNASITLDAGLPITRVRLGAGAVGAISFQTTTDLFHNASGSLFQFDANTTGAGSLNKHGVGTVTFTRNNSFNGLNLSGGSVVAWNTATALGTNATALGATGSSSNVSLFFGSTLSYTNAITVSSGSGTRLIGNTDVASQLGLAAITGNATLSGGIDLSAGQGVTLAITNYGASTDRLTVSGAITGTGGVTKTGNGILLLAASNSYSGATDIQGGKLFLGTAGRLGSGAVTISSGANLDFGTGALQTNIVSNNISGDGQIIQSTASTETRITGDVTSTGGLTIQNGTLRIGNNTGTGSYSGSTTISNAATLVFDRTNAYTHVGAISGAGNVTKVSTGDVTLTASNSYSGTTTLFAAALVASNAHALGTGNITFSLGGGNTGTIRYTAASAGTDWASRIKSSTGTIRLDTAGNNVTLAGAIDNSNTNGLAKSGTGTLTLAGTNTYLGNTTVSGGTLNVSSAGSLAFVIGGSGTNNAIVGGATTVIDGRFVFDLTAASTNTNATWTIVAGSLTNSYGTNFLVTGFNGAGGLWTNTTNGVDYVFAQSNSVLRVQPALAPTPYNAWVAYWQGVDPGFTNTAGTDNPDGDPFDNNEEFAFDGNPTIGTGALLTATKVGTNTVFNYVAMTNTNAVTYQVQVTGNLTTGWTNSGVTVSNSANQTGISQTNVYQRREFTVPAAGNSFYRVQATVAP